MRQPPAKGRQALAIGREPKAARSAVALQSAVRRRRKRPKQSLPLASLGNALITSSHYELLIQKRNADYPSPKGEGLSPPSLLGEGGREGEVNSHYLWHL